MEHYPTKQEMAKTALMDEFVRLVNYQEEKPMFNDGMVALNADNTSPVYFSSRQVAAIAEMLRDMSADNSQRWNQEACAAVYELAARAEQHENDNPEHLMHTMMSIYDCVAQAGGCYGALNCRHDEEGVALAIPLYYEYDEKYVLPCLARVPYAPRDAANTIFYSITEVILRYTDSGCTLSFKAHPADEQMTILPADEQNLFERKVWPGETELPASAVWTAVQKEIADYILSAMYENPCDASPLRKFGDGRWIATNRGVVEVDGTTSCVEAGWEDDKVKKTDEARCEACEKYKSKYIEYPITVNKIDVKPIEYDSWHCKTGDLVAVRPCGEKYEKKTYLGFFLGDLPKAIWPTFNSKDGVLSIDTMRNPAMFVPELGEIIWGCGSWWHKVKSEKELREITDKDINDTWYVKLARQLQEKERANRPEDSVTLKVGDRFKQAWKGCKEPMWFKVLSIARPFNKLRVECHSFEGYTHEEDWDDLNLTEVAFSIGEYKMMEV